LWSWRIQFRQIGFEFGRPGIKDREIIPLLHSLRRTTFFTRDDDFFDRKLCHAKYCLVHLAVRKDEVAVFVRRTIRHPEFDTEAKRMGSVIRASHVGLAVWRLHSENQIRYDWTD
jgi:hypothetical protein